MVRAKGSRSQTKPEGENFTGLTMWKCTMILSLTFYLVPGSGKKGTWSRKQALYPNNFFKI